MVALPFFGRRPERSWRAAESLLQSHIYAGTKFPAEGHG